MIIGGIAAGAALYAGRGVFRQRQQLAASEASGLETMPDLTHVPAALQRTALWALADGGFERRVLHGVVSRGGDDLALTVFDLETLRERRGEWGYLPVEPPFRIAATVSVACAAVARTFPHVLLKRTGHGDDMADDTAVDRVSSLTKLARTGLGVPRSYAAALPAGLGPVPLDVALPEQWRAYGDDAAFVASLLAGGFASTLESIGRRDLVIELLDDVVVIYPAARDVSGADALADLAATATALVESVLAATPRRRLHPIR